MMPRRAEIKGLFYITHVENIPSVLERGILSHAIVEAEHVAFTPIYDAAIVSKRKDKALRNVRVCGNTPTYTFRLVTP